MRRCEWLLILAVLTVTTSLGGTLTRAADEPAAKVSSKKGDRKAQSADPAEWKKLVARRKEIMKEAESLQKEAQDADAAGKRKIKEQLDELSNEFRFELQPKIVELAPAIFEQDPTDLDAAEVIIGQAFQDNKYREVVSMAQTVLDSGKTSAPLLTLLGISQFATHEFTKAKANLEKAKQADKQVFPRLGAPFLEACDEYIAFWKKEQEIRAREKEADDLPRVAFKTTKGDIVLELFENEAPNTVANFISLVEAGKYDGIAFHRVIPNFMAQGGDPNTLDDDPANDGGGGPGYTIACECYRDDTRMHFQGSISMAHAGKDTGGSQFFLTHLPTAHLNRTEGKDQSNHTVFGRIIKGMDAALAIRPGDRIETAEVLRKRDHEYSPKTSGKTKGAKRSKGS